MANVIARRLLLRRPVNIFEYSSLAAVPCSNIFKNVFYVSLKNHAIPNPEICTNQSKAVIFQVYRPRSSSDKKYDKEKEEKKEEKIPVHIVTSAAWFGGFYYLAKSGVDIVALLESWHVSEKFTNPLKDSSMGYIAVAYALYKISTPARYTVTLGGTTISINYLKKWGYIKPVPSTEQMKKIYQEKKVNLTKSMQETKGNILEKRDHIIETIQEKKEEIKEKKDNIIKTVSKSTGRLSKRSKYPLKPKVSLKTKEKT